MSKDIIVPAAGESVTEADIAEWKKADGEYVNVDDAVVELETDKASLDVTAQVAGILRVTIAEGETVRVGDVIGTIVPGDPPAGSAAGAVPVAASAPTPVAVPVSAEKPPSPAAKKMMAEQGIQAADISGTGKDGRITKGDVLQVSVDAVAVPDVAEDLPSAAPRRERMSRLRRTIASRLVNAQQTAALLTTFNEVDVPAVMAIRSKYKEDFKKKYDVNLGFMSFFTVAVCRALEEHPVLNAFVDGEEIVYPAHCDIGVAISTPKGLVVPVVRAAECMSFSEIEQSILELALRGREGKLSMDDMDGGTFSITNGGIFGSMLSTPIVNAPQSAILGMHNIVQRPVAVDGQVEIRPMMYVAVSYDHRIIDGADAVRFLVSIKQRLEDPTRLLIGV